MEKMLKPQEIANILSTKLNTLSLLLYEEEKITKKILFHVVADYQMYERFQKGEYEINDNQRITPCIINRLDFDSSKLNFGNYNETYSIQIYGYFDEVFELEEIIKTLVYYENTEIQTETIDDWEVNKHFDDINFGEEIFPLDGTDEKRVEGVGSFSLEFISGVKTSHDFILSLDGEEIPYLSFNYSIDKAQSGTSGDSIETLVNGMFDSEIIITFNYQTGVTKILELIEDIQDHQLYNKKYTLNIDDGENDIDYDVYISRGEFSVIKPYSLPVVTVVFSRYTDKVSIKLNDEAVLVANFSYDYDTQVDITNLINDTNSKAIPTFDSFSINMDILLDGSTIATQLKKEALKRDFGKLYELTFVDTDEEEITFKVLSKKILYSFTDNPTSFLNCTFIKYDEILDEGE